MLQSIQALIITLLLTAFTFADVFMTELTDPQNSSDAGRYVELYNNGDSDVDLSSGWKIQRWTNGNADPTASSIKDLTGTIVAGGFYIICNDADKFSTTYGLTCDQDIGTGGAADSNGDDNMAILDASGAIADMFGVAGEDGSGTGHEFEDGRAERAEGVTAANATWDETEWNIDNDSGGGDGNQYAPEGFDPGAWIGATAGGDTCDDESACNTGADGDCEYPDTGYDCDGNCVGEVDCAGICGGDAVEDCFGECGGSAVVDECGECGGSNACLISVTFNVNMALEDVSADGVGLYGIDGDWSTGISMSDDDGDGIFSTTVAFAPESFHLYKFKNGSWENVDELECAWFDDPDGDGFGYWDRYLNLAGITEDLNLGSVCFGGCEDCATEVLGCMDPLADNYNPDANVDDGSCEYTIPDPANLFFSEYAEGSSNNKYLEIYNADSEWIDLAGYSLSSCSNGCNDGESWDYPDNVTFSEYWLEPGTVYVVCHGSSDDFILAECDQTFTYLSNGDDVFALTQVGSGTILDIIGTIGDDPGSGWEVAGVSNGTKDHTLVRDASVLSGNDGNWEESAGDADGSEWVVLDQNTWDFLGSHPHDFSVTCNDDTACNFGEEGDCTFADEGYDCDGNAYIEVTFNVNMAEQTVDTEGYGLDLFLDDPYGYHDMSDDDGDGVWSVTLTLLANTTYEYKFKNGDEWEGNFNDLGCGAGDGSTYGNRIFTSGDSDMSLDSVCFNSCTDCEEACTMGDVNGDGDVNVLDIVQIVGFIVEGGDDFDIACADSNGDGSIDVLDIVSIVNGIVNGRVAIDDATSAKIIKSANGLTLQADGYIGGVQMTLRHDADFIIELNDNAWISDYATSGNQTILVIVEPSEGELFTTSGNYEIVDMIIANSHDAITAMVVREFALSDAYPNPFNPSTTVELTVPEAGHVSVMVYNIAGQLMAELADSYMDANQYQFTWQGENLPSGMYLLRAEYAGQVSTQKLMLLK